MRLGLISARYPFGAAEPYLDTELRALAPSLDALVVVPTTPPSAAPGFRPPGEVVALPLFGAATLRLAMAAVAAAPLRALGTLIALVVASRRPGTIAKNLAVYPKGLAVATLARRAGLEHLHAYWLSTPATVAWIAARVARIGFSATAHRWDIYEDNMGARKLADATFVRTISERGRRDLLARAGGDPSRVRVVRLGVALPSPAAPRAGGGPLRIVCAAALVPVKGHAVLLDALRRLRDDGVAFEATLAGDGPLRDDLAGRIAAAGLDGAVRLAGTIPHDALLAQLEGGEYDVAVLASIERPGGLMEGVPVALVEAMAAGTVVVATDSGSIGELINGTSGLLVPHSEPGALAAALARVARDPALCAALRGAARATVSREYDVAATTATLRALLARGVTEGSLGYEDAGIATEAALARDHG